MYRVVLIDDENIIVEGLRRVIRWGDYNCEVAGTASSAEEGTELIRKVQPHILFTDIHMPGKDGRLWWRVFAANFRKCRW